MKEAIEYVVVFSAAIVLIVYMVLQGHTTILIASDTIKQDRLRQEAEVLMDSLIMSNGHPSNWGSLDLTWSGNRIVDFERIPPEKFGLALQGSRTLYTLSPAKVNMLVNGWLSWEDVLRTLGVGRLVRLSLKPLIRGDIEYIGSASYRISLLTWDGKPLAGAYVRGILIYIVRGGSTAELRLYETEAEAGVDGTTNLSFSVPSNEIGYLEETGVLNVYVSYGLLANMLRYVHNGERYIAGEIVEDVLLLYMSGEDSGARHVSDEIIVYTPSGASRVVWDTTQGENNNIINKGSKNVLPIELDGLGPSAIFVAGGVKFRGNWYTFVVYTPFDLTRPGEPAEFEIGSTRGAENVFTTSRMVTISGLTYIMELSMGA